MVYIFKNVHKVKYVYKWYTTVYSHFTTCSVKFSLGTRSTNHSAHPPHHGNYTVLSCTVLYCTALECTSMYCAALHFTVLYFSELCCSSLQCHVICCTKLKCNVLYIVNCLILYCIAQRPENASFYFTAYSSLHFTLCR